MANDDIEASSGDAPAAQPKKKPILLFSAIGGIVLTVAIGAGLHFSGVLSGGAEEGAEVAEAEATQEEAPKTAVYHALNPSFVVNFHGRKSPRYLKVDVQVMARDEGAIEAVKQHEPMIRNNLLMLFGAQDADLLKTRDGKEQLRGNVLAEVQGILQNEIGKPGVESVFFTSFVMQ